MSVVGNFLVKKQFVACAIAVAVSSMAAGAQAHAFNQVTSASDSESRGNDNYASSYNWTGSTRNYELVSAGIPTRHSYAAQIFDMSTKIFGDQRQIIRVSSTADAWYRKSGANAATYSRMQTASVIINDTELLRCTASGGCSDVRDVSQEFYAKSKSIDFGILGSETLTSRVIGDISLDVSSSSSSAKYLGLETGFLSNSVVDLVVGVHVLSRQSMSGTPTRDYRLLSVDIDAQERARQGTTGTAAQTSGRLTWSNKEFVDMAHMDGRIFYTKSSPIWPSQTRELVNVPTVVWTGQYVDDTGSTEAF